MTALGLNFLRTRQEATADGHIGLSSASVFNQNLQTAMYGRGSGGVSSGDGRDGVKMSPQQSSKVRNLRSGTKAVLSVRKKAVVKVEGGGRKAKDVRRRRLQIVGKVSKDIAQKIIKRKCVEQRARV